MSCFFIIFLKNNKKKQDLQNLYRIVILSNENVTNFIYLRSFYKKRSCVNLFNLNFIKCTTIVKIVKFL